jgi:serine phosphatase RsbU (regulator of sigma subunit)/Tfp pilus assembly protein PilF
VPPSKWSNIIFYISSKIKVPRELLNAVLFFGFMKQCIRLVLVFCVLLIAGPKKLVAQKTKGDSLRADYNKNPNNHKAYTALFNYWKKDKKDSASWLVKKILIEGEKKTDSLLIGDAYSLSGQIAITNSEYESAIVFYKKADNYYGTCKDSVCLKRKIELFLLLGRAQSLSGNPRLAIIVFENMKQISLEANDTISAITSLLQKGEEERTLGNTSAALATQLEALKLATLINSEENQARCYNNIANVYSTMSDRAKAKEYYRKSLSIKLRSNNKRDIANGYSNLGTMFLDDSLNYDSALYYFDLSLPLKIETKDMRSIAITYNNIGRAYALTGRFVESKKALDEAIRIRTEMKDKTGLAASYAAMGMMYRIKKEYPEAIRYFKMSSDLFKETGGIKRFNDNQYETAVIYYKMGDYKNAYDYLYNFSTIRDTLLSSDRIKEANELQAVFDANARDQTIKQLQQDKINDDLKKTADEERQKKQTYILIGGVLLAIFVAGFFIFRYFENQKSRKKLELAFVQIEEKNKNITDSIRYAQRIQQSILPPMAEFERIFPDSFVLYKPKDIVSGDFWWMYKLDQDRVAFAVADCTGHGVPGAFMSVLGSDLLAQGAKDPDIREPSEGLSFLDQGVRSQLKQTGIEGESRDGMDIALMLYDRKAKSILFSGAMRPMLHIRNGQMKEYSGSRYSIGGAFDGTKKFELHYISVEPGDMIYLFTDGFVDQFGGPNGKKYKSAKLKELLTSNSSLTGKQQKDNLISEYENWKGELEQVDDICIAGISIK